MGAQPSHGHGSDPPSGDRVVKPHAVKVMGEHGAFPIWVTEPVEDLGDVDPAELPISDELATALSSWGEDYSGFIDENPDDQGEQAAYRDWLGRGMQLAQRLRGELGPDTQVSYFHDAELRGRPPV